VPYEEESPIGAAIGVAGGFMQGQQQAKQQALENARLQQQIIAQQAQMALEQRRADSEEKYQQFDMNDRTRARNISEGKDPDHPDRLITSELPPALQVGVSPKAPLQAQYDKNMKIAMFFLSRGFKEQAAPYLDAAQNAAQQMNSMQTFQRDFAKAIVLANYTTSRELGLNQARQQGEVGVHQADRDYDVTHPLPNQLPKAKVPTFGEVNGMLNEWVQGTQAQTGTDMVSKSPIYSRVPPPPAQKLFVESAVSQIQNSSNPQAAAMGAIAAYKKNFKGGDPQAIRILRAAADSMNPQSSDGGSDATLDPQYPGP
jgi:hypothetical protein